MNITIKITHAFGTVMEVSIPVLDSAPVQVAPAVVTPNEVHVASEPAIPVAGGLVDTFCNEVTKEDLKPSGKRYTSVADMVEAFESSRENTLGKERVGEEGEGDGRIGGMGERKEEGGEGEGGEENRVLIFKCQDGNYTLPPTLHADFCSAFGAPTANLELTKARLWCETNQQNRKTRRGMGRFLNAWLCRAQGEKRQSIKSRSGSLLEANNTSQKGW
ncbi:hypothetical protein UFOVP298_13 [uncultured Caudovirales phage]|uniref:Uncharacterized protein n=1 Tax=uncultured Caudovirales phage TaxID=2100421 RepID=A0A6J5LSQ1_9CAUD|nr:hypothetical protein UFOVP298_13 [uncultured Caudovirales phage]CAB4150759.1 hypothetical protein UFOVP572_26 [uncultured Caudovirales phage]